MSNDKSKPTSPENLVQSSSTARVELSESELDKVNGGRKAGEQPKEYLKIKLEDIQISSVES